jgi:hypothetical protein
MSSLVNNKTIRHLVLFVKMSGGGDFVRRGENDIVKIEINVLNLSFPPALEYPLRPFRFFLKIRRNIRNSRCTTGINDTGGKQWEQLSNC